MTLTKLAKTAVAALEDIKGRDIVALDVRKLTSLFDKVVIATVSMTGLDISATFVRTALGAAKSVRYLLPDSVLDYIQSRGLYH